ncbi:DUF3558 family protein [Rhodococcus rhodnii]|uniref:DUF3558 domain-containing protein n=1 Tax=Rhodococcus rhodnii LMG 5362 TaxID=1273125 RepID=R7WM60_9NOCA|nr:DUF3558 family protein [Rhodococcus rhodnii]EOM76378.1 hypothetical protein Rrhod_2171 [Rhodococcus rhodnii LMG 5362]
MKFGIAAVAAVALVSGCGDSTAVESESERPVMFEPCDDIPDEAIAELGFDPATADRGVAGVDQWGWGICKWSGETHNIAISYAERSLESLRDTGNNTDIRHVGEPTPEAHTWRRLGEEEFICEVTWPNGTGAGQLTVYKRPGADGERMTENICDAAVGYAIALGDLLPRG